jgi:hypothetical protein
LIGSVTGNSWICTDGIKSLRRFNIDLGEGKIIRRVYYENSHSSGLNNTRGVKDFTFQGSHLQDSFDVTTYTVNTGWTDIPTSASQCDIHVASDVSDPKYFLVNNNVAYRYYSFKFINNWGYENNLGIRRIELQTEDGYGTFTPKIFYY